MARKFYYNERNARELLKEALHVIASGEETHYSIPIDCKYKERDRGIADFLASRSGEQIQEIMDRIYPTLDESGRVVVNTMFKVTENDARLRSSKLPLKRALGASAIFAGELESAVQENKLEGLISLDNLQLF